MDEKSSKSLPIHYSGKFEGSFAYITIKDRLPVILVKVVDTLCKDINSIGAEFGEDAKEEVKKVIGRLSALQNEMITNKPLVPLRSNGLDIHLWNKYLEKQNSENDYSAAWYVSSWLYVECYLYRRIKEAFELSPVLEDYDPFSKQKEESLMNSMNGLVQFGEMLKQSMIDLQTSTDAETKLNLFKFYLQVSLWGNQCDLSLFSSSDSTPHTLDVERVKSKILVNDSEKAWKVLQARNGDESASIHFVLDNAGYELFCDFCFLHFLTASKLVSKVMIHVKKMPWFVSDTMSKDVDILLETLSNSQSDILRDFSRQWRACFSSGQWKIEEEMFWTLPHDYSEMSSTDLQLYQKLSQSDLVIFKGDLNYRKLTGDRQWCEETPFEKALNGFRPTSVLALRTTKADVVVGLEPGTTQRLNSICSRWKFSGEYALIQLAEKDRL